VFKETGLAVFSEKTLAYAEELTSLLLGLDALYAAEQGQGDRGAGGDIERLVVLNMSTRHQPEPLASYADARVRVGELQALAAGLAEPDRRLYYGQVCGSAIAFSTWRESGLSFDRQVSDFLHVTAATASEAQLDALRGRMRTLLTDIGYSGDLEQQFSAWEDRHRVPADEVNGVLTELLAECWDRTEALMEIPATRDDYMQVETTTGVPYNAMCDFSRRLIRLNTDPILTMPGLRHLAVHEGCPGHYVQFKRREVGYARGIAPADGLLSVVNTASSTTFEGIADVGTDVIGWRDDPDGRIGELLARYRSGLGTRAAWRLHAEGRSPDAVKDELQRDALVGGEGWVDARMRFISRHDRAALIWSYWHGDPSVFAVWEKVREAPDRQLPYFDYIYGRMHSPQSIALFQA
jgi:hypothetical protein